MPDETSIKVTSETAGERLDKFLAASLVELSRSAIQRFIENGDVLVNERVVKVGYKVRPNDLIEFEFPAPTPTELLPEPIPLDIIYEDDDLIVINKPAGLVVHPGAGVANGTLANALVWHFNQLSTTAGTIRPGIVHRIDKGTSGLLVAAKNDVAHQALAEQFASRAVYKKYLALCFGRVAQNQGVIDEPIGRDQRLRTRMAIRKVGGRPALSLYTARERFDELTLLEVEIKTGRTHQIRVHLAHLNNPVVGDKLYSAGRVNTIKSAKLKQAINALDRQFLHAAELGFTHPRTKERQRFTAPLPAELLSFIALLKG